jgi:hypothetical protein
METKNNNNLIVTKKKKLFHHIVISRDALTVCNMTNVYTPLRVRWDVYMGRTASSLLVYLSPLKGMSVSHLSGLPLCSPCEGSCPILQSRRCIERLRPLGLWLSTDQLTATESRSPLLSCLSASSKPVLLTSVFQWAERPTAYPSSKVLPLSTMNLGSGWRQWQARAGLDSVFIDGSVIMSDLVRDTLSSRELSVVDVDGGRHSAAVRIRPYVGFNYLSHTVPHGALRSTSGPIPRHACVLQLQ